MIKKNGKVVAIVPAHNEEEKIRDTIIGLNSIEYIDEIIVVDDGSADNTAVIAKDMDTKLIKLDKNKGKGYAIKKAIEDLDYEYLVLVDADLGETSKEIEKLIIPVINNEVDITIAKFPKPAKKGGFGCVKKLAKNGVYFYTGKEINSSLSGQRVYKKNVIDDIKYIPDRFGIEVAMTVEALRKGYSIKEIDANMVHSETGRNLKGFVHRGKQFWDIFRTLIILFFRR